MEKILKISLNVHSTRLLCFSRCIVNTNYRQFKTKYTPSIKIALFNFEIYVHSCFVFVSHLLYSVEVITVSWTIHVHYILICIMMHFSHKCCHIFSNYIRTVFYYRNRTHLITLIYIHMMAQISS